MSRRHRLRTAADIRRVIRQGRSVTAPGLVLYHLPRDGREPSRFGFSVPRTVGSAVVRNRLRRLLREACRALIPRIAASDVVIVARPTDAPQGLAELQMRLTDAMSRAGLTEPHTKEGTPT